jgi:hypothetical protein
MSTEPQGSVRNAHESIIPFHVFKQLELHAVLKSLLPKRSRHGLPR